MIMPSWMRILCSGLLLGGAATYGQTSAAKFVPETVNQRWHEYLADSLTTPSPYFASLVPAAFEQWDGRQPEWGQGMKGYAKRVGARMAMVELQAAFYHGGALAIGEDTRYERCGCSGAMRRVGHAVSRTFVTRSRSGSLVPRVALFGGYMGGALVSSTWYPASDGLGRQAQIGALQIGYATFEQIGKEFAPEIRRLFRRK